MQFLGYSTRQLAKKLIILKSINNPGWSANRIFPHLIHFPVLNFQLRVFISIFHFRSFIHSAAKLIRGIKNRAVWLGGDGARIAWRFGPRRSLETSIGWRRGLAPQADRATPRGTRSWHSTIDSNLLQALFKKQSACYLKVKKSRRHQLAVLWTAIANNPLV